MKRKTKRNIFSWLLVISMMIPMLSSGFIAKAATSEGNQNAIESESESVVEYSNIAQFRGTIYTAPTKGGYVFAGWYRDTECKEPIGVDVKEGSAFAKFVPEQVLGVKTQVSVNVLPPNQTDENTKGAIRFVTSVDSLDYAEVGFYINIGETGETVYANSKVYDKLFYIDTNGTSVSKDPEEAKTMTPQALFCSESQYFKTQTFVGIPSSQFDVEITVAPFWKTLDGTIVRGNTVTRCVNDGKKAGSYVVKTYEELQTVLQFIKDNKLTDEITIKVAGSFEIADQIALAAGYNIVLVNEGGTPEEPITIYRGKNLATANMFWLSPGGNLTIRGMGENGSFVFDGRTQEDATAGKELDNVVGSTGSLIINYGNVTIENAIVQYVKKTASSGSVISNNHDGKTNAAAMVTIRNSVFKNNGSANYGSVLYSNAQVNIVGSKFENNRASKEGGVIYNTGKELIITDSTFISNNGGNHGGAIYNTGASLAIDNCTFMNNAGKSGGAVLNSGAGGKIENSHFIGNHMEVGGGRGGAIYNDGTDFAVLNTEFTGNTSIELGGAVANYSGTITLTDCSFEGNTAGTYGGAIHTAGGTLTLQGTDVEKAIFQNNEAIISGGAVYLGGGTLNGSGYLFINNRPEDIYRAGGTNNYKEYSATTSTELRSIINTIEGLATTDAVCIKITESFELANDITIPTGCNIVLLNEGGTPDDPVVIYRKASGAMGNITVSKGATLTIRGAGEKGSFILDGRTQEEINKNASIDTSIGGTRNLFVNNGNLTLDNLTVQYMKRTANGGAVVNNTAGATLSIRNSVFDHNYAAGQGSVLYSVSKISIAGSTFTNNASGSHGGAIYNTGASLAIDNCTFSNNAGASGGAVFNSGDEGKIENSHFIENQMAVTNGRGGAIYNTGTDFTVLNTEFTGNTSIELCGAVANFNGTITLTDCSFKDNKAGTYGGAIHNAGGTLTLQGIDVEKAVFQNNTAISGGAVYLNAGTLNGSGYTFKDNTPDNIYVAEGTDNYQY